MTNIKLMRLLLHLFCFFIGHTVINLIYVTGYIHGYCIKGLPIAQELDADLFSILVYPLHSKGKDGHSAAAQIVSW